MPDGSALYRADPVHLCDFEACLGPRQHSRSGACAEDDTFGLTCAIRSSSRLQWPPIRMAFDGTIGTSIDIHEVTTMSQSNQREPILLRRKDVQFRTGLARSTMYLYIQQGAFPKPVRLGRRAVGWLESEVSAWITERVRMARDSQRAAQ